MNTQNRFYENNFERVFWIEREIREKRYPNANTIAQHFEISDKTAQRALEFMRNKLRLEIEYSPQHRGWYYINDPIPLSAITLNQEEYQTILLAARFLQSHDQMLDPSIQAAFTKITQAALLKEKQNIIPSVDKIPTANYETHFSQQIQQAIQQNKFLEILYFSPNNQQQTTRTIQPYALHYANGSWYLIAFDENRQDYRNFHLSRIEKLTLLKEKFNKKEFDLEKYLNENFQMIRGEKSIKVELAFDAYQAQWLREKSVIHPSAKYQEQDDGSLIITLTVTETDSIQRFILQYGEHVKVLQPKSLQQKIVQSLQASLQNYV